MLVSQTKLERQDELDVVRLGLDLPAAAASAFEDIRRKFTNQRQWREFVSALQSAPALQCTVNYAAVLRSTLRTGKRWLSHPFSR